MSKSLLFNFMIISLVLFMQQNSIINYAPRIPSLCTETDNGRDYYMKGSTIGYLDNKLIALSDYCISRYRLMEYYCVGNQVKNILNLNTLYGDFEFGVYCDNGCRDGACQ